MCRVRVRLRQAREQDLSAVLRHRLTRAFTKVHKERIGTRPIFFTYILGFMLTGPSHPQPRTINTDQARLYAAAISGVKKEVILRHRCRHRAVQYLNNILEQDHRAINDG